MMFVKWIKRLFNWRTTPQPVAVAAEIAEMHPGDAEEECNWCDVLQPEKRAAAERVGPQSAEEVLRARIKTLDRQVARLHAAIFGAMRRETSRFRHVAPDIKEAIDFLETHYAMTIMRAKPELSADDINAEATAVTHNLVVVALSQDNNPAELVYRRAWAVGYRPEGWVEGAPEDLFSRVGRTGRREKLH